MNRIVIDPKSELCQKHNSKVDKYDVVEKNGGFVVTNLESGNNHYVSLVKRGNLEFEGSCDCEDFGFRRKQNEEPCTHIYKVVFEANLNDSLNIPDSGESETKESDVVNQQQEQQQEQVTEITESREEGMEMEELSKELGKMNVETVKRYIAPKEANDTEVKLFCNICAARGANPFLNEAHLVKYTKDEPARVIISKDFFLKKARLAKDFQGFKAGIIVKNKDGEIERREGSFLAPDEELLGGWSHVLLDGKEPVKSEVNLEKYMKTRRDGQPTRFWKEIPETMIRKVALSQALREAFPEELGGLYGEEEQRSSINQS